MPKIRIQCLRTRGRQKYGTKKYNCIRENSYKLDGIHWVNSSQNARIVNQKTHTQYKEHRKPDKHHRAKSLTHKSGAELLEKEQSRQNCDHNRNNRNIRVNQSQALNG